MGKTATARREISKPAKLKEQEAEAAAIGETVTELMDRLEKAGWTRDEAGIWCSPDGKQKALVDPPQPIPQFDAKELTGKLTDFLVGEIKAARSERIAKPWSQLTESEQRWHIDRCDSRAHALVYAIAQAIAAKGFTSIDAIMDGGSFKGSELVLKLKAPFSAENLGKLTGKGTVVQVVFADANQFAGGMTAKPEPDQGELDVEEDDEAEADEPVSDREQVDPDTGEITDAPPAGDNDGQTYTVDEAAP